MILLKSYIPISQITKLSGDSPSSVHKNFENVSEKIGGLTIVRKDFVPNKYKQYIPACLDLSSYFPSYELSRTIGRSSDYLSHARLRYNKPVEFKKVGRVTMVKLTDEFVKNVEKGLEPFCINSLEDSFDDYEYDSVIDFYGIKIGFYK